MSDDHQTDGIVQIEKEADTIRIEQSEDQPSLYILSASAPRWKGGQFQESETLARLYQDLLKSAADHQIESLAFPAISTGVYHFPLKEAAKIAAASVCEFLQERPSTFTRLVWVVFDEKTRYVYQRIFEQVADEQEVK